MIALMIVVADERIDLRFEVTGQEVVFQQDAVLQRLMPAFDLALGLWMVRRAACMWPAPSRWSARFISPAVST